MSYDYPYGIPPINIMDRARVVVKVGEREIRQELVRFDNLVNVVHDDDPNVPFLQGVQIALSWVLMPTIFESPLEALRTRNVNFLKVSG